MIQNSGNWFYRLKPMSNCFLYGNNLIQISYLLINRNLYIMLFPWLILYIIPYLSSPDLKPIYISGFAQGTSYQITYYAKDSMVFQAQIDSIFSAIDSSLSIYKPYSLISQFNRSESSVKADKHLKAVIKKSLQIAKKTNGVFDITVHPLVQAWGFGTKTVSAPPGHTIIQSILKCVGPGKVYLQNGKLIKKEPCVKIDVNGIAQGYTVDVLGEYLEKKNIKNYLVELGGEIRIKGRKQPGGQLFSIGIEGPGGNGLNLYPLQKIIRLKKGAVTTSGNYRRYYQYGTERISHLIDPKTGYPLQNEMISATIWAKDAITADGYDNALMGMGLEKALQFVNRQQDMEAYIIYKQATGAVADTATAGFYKLMD